MKTKNGVLDTVIQEEYVGTSGNRICFPGISSCITITAVLPTGLVGTHITVGTPLVLINELLRGMKTGGGGNCANFYVIGGFTDFKSNANAEINTRKKIRDKIKSSINKNAIVRFYDSSPLREVHIFSERNGGNTRFYWIKSEGNRVTGYTYPEFAGRTEITANQFVIR